MASLRKDVSDEDVYALNEEERLKMVNSKVEFLLQITLKDKKLMASEK